MPEKDQLSMNEVLLSTNKTEEIEGKSRVRSNVSPLQSKKKSTETVDYNKITRIIEK